MIQIGSTRCVVTLAVHGCAADPPRDATIQPAATAAAGESGEVGVPRSRADGHALQEAEVQAAVADRRRHSAIARQHARDAAEGWQHSRCGSDAGKLATLQLQSNHRSPGSRYHRRNDHEVTVPAIIALRLAAAIAIHIPNSSQHPAIHCIEPSRPPRAAASFVHGATFPTQLASGYEFSPNDSWLAFVAAQGFLACGFDFVGFGASSRPAAMLEAAERGAPVRRGGSRRPDRACSQVPARQARLVHRPCHRPPVALRRRAAFAAVHSRPDLFAHVVRASRSRVRNVPADREARRVVWDEAQTG